ncbi:hypothetical protein PHYBOEH_001020 [Phytophthora boehmeriae]|uniref:TKL protein kinase n=1 Tax=Phytophthora boehmeriae TaxID=109152 RepID=A0A8T1X659_9STRA|nr:hypothetical protein PHYBOEH_001020 [Phytophthora boehmeriae]
MFINENRDTSNSSLALIQSSTNSSNITTLSLYNLDLNTVAASNSGFVPVTVTDLTLRDCNISTLGSSFTRDWSSLRYVDLSSNRLAETYVGGDHLKELNVSFNSLTGFPWATMVMNTSALDALHIQGNDIADFNVTEDEFVKIQSLSAFTADQPATSSSCQDGAWQAAHGTTFCVLGASTAAVPDSSKSSGSNGDDDSNGLGIITYWLIGGAIVVFLLLLVLLWQRRCHDRENDSSPVVSPEATGPNTPKYTGNVALEDATSRDVAPVVAPRERNFQYVANTHSGYGRSHGNSVESEDSALAVSLANNSSLHNCPPAILELAARCLRADPDERPRASEIVLYLQSIMQERSSIMSAASLPRPGISFDLNTRGSITSPPSQPAPANSVVNLGFSSEQLRQQQTTTTTANYMAGKRSRLSTTKTTTTTTSSRDTGSTSGSHPTAAEALAPAHEIVVSPPAGVSRKVVRTKLPGKGKRTTTTTTTTTRRSSQGSAGVVDDGSYTIEQSSEDDSFRSFGAETVQGLPRSEEVSIDNNRQGQNWVAYEENVREL